jgi:hypothetical protein
MIDINDIKEGDTVLYADGKRGVVKVICAKIIDATKKPKVLAQARFMIDLEGGGGRYHTHRKDGVSHREQAGDIVAIIKKAC